MFQTVVSYQMWAANTSPSNFVSPEEFIPERWLDAEEAAPRQKSKRDFAKDKRDAFQPFLQGPRDCIGQNLARVELRLIIGHMLYAFDMTAPGDISKLMAWENQRTYAVWDRSPLPIQLSLA